MLNVVTDFTLLISVIKIKCTKPLICTYLGIIIGHKNYQRTYRITMMLVHKVLDCFQVAIRTGKREWCVTSLVDCT